jgi:uncharacterized protein
MKPSQFLSSEDILLRLERRLGRRQVRLRMGMEREHEAQAFGQGLTFLHLENMPIMQAVIEIVLRGTGTYWRGHSNAAKVIVNRNAVHLPALPASFDGFTILHLSDLHADMSQDALQRAAELSNDLEYDLCVLTGDFRGRTHGDFVPTVEVIARLRQALRDDIYAVLGHHDSITMVPDLEALGIKFLLSHLQNS